MFQILFVEEIVRKILLTSSILLFVFLFTGCSAILEKYNEPIDPTDLTEVLFEVPAGASTALIANQLVEAGLIQNANAFRAKSRELEVDGQMKAGNYLLSPSMNAEQIIQKMVKGEVHRETRRFTIPEGYEVRQIVDRLEAEGIVNRERFVDVLASHPFDFPFLEGVDRSYLLEGFLFPDTYEIEVNASEVYVVQLMLNRFNEVFQPEFYERAEELGMSVIEVVTFASIVEREARLDQELELVSSVFHNRLEKQMLLQSCATIQYVLMERKDRLTFADLEVVSPFNTYANIGLTPGPIASPGARAIEATLYPAETNYLYFATTEKNDGSHYFNETYAGHLRDAEKGKGQ